MGFKMWRAELVESYVFSLTPNPSPGRDLWSLGEGKANVVVFIPLLPPGEGVRG
jgi:hypothetical protein